MADTIVGFARLALAATYTKDLDLNDPTAKLSQVWEEEFASGSGSGQINKLFYDTRSLAGAADEDLDLAGGVTDAFGTAVTFTKIKVLAIRNNTSAQALSVGGAAANQFVGWVANSSDIVVIQGGSMALLICDPAGVTVTAGTGDLLKIALAAGDAGTYDIVILGV